MKSRIALLAIITGYVTFAGIVISAVFGLYGADSIAAYIAVIIVGPVGFGILITHKGLNSWLNELQHKQIW